MDVFTRNYGIVCLDKVYKEHVFAYLTLCIDNLKLVLK